jgi:hypothetical protein
MRDFGEALHLPVSYSPATVRLSHILRTGTVLVGHSMLF